MVGCLAAAEDDDDDDDTTTSDKDKGREEVMATKTRRETVGVGRKGGWPVQRANLRQLETFFFAAF